MDRREFLAALGAVQYFQGSTLGGPPYTVRYRKPGAHASFVGLIDPSNDTYACEREAASIASHLNALLERRSLPLAAEFRGISPLPVHYSAVAQGVAEAVYDPSRTGFEAGLRSWVQALGEVRRASFFPLPDHRVRYEIASKSEYRVGVWKQVWKEGKLAEFAPIREAVTTADPMFHDVTATMFRNAASFKDQLLGGNTWWRARLDAACGIDVYAHNGIAVGDIDNDGWDEVYVCQQAGLPNRLYKIGLDGAFEDITERSGLGVLDDTSSALFLDVRNSGSQDVVVLCSSGPLLFLNDGRGAFRHVRDAFRFATEPQGAFTGMAAADYDRDGRIDLYFCSYVYFQSEDQYRYPVPYHDARNGPPNFLFRNRFDAEGGYFEDATEAAGLNHNNDRYSFAAAWRDFDGDGWPDLYVANDFGRSNLYRNNGGRFRDEAVERGAENIGPAMSAAWFDYDLDGRPDLYVSNMWTAAGQRVVRDGGFTPGRNSPEAYRGHTMGNSLFRNRGDGGFDRVPEADGAAMGRWAWSADAFDFDNDGVPEILVACGMLTNPSPVDLDSFFWRQVAAHSPSKATSAPDYEKGWNAINQFIREDYSWSGRQPNAFYVRPRPVPGGTARYHDFSGASGLDFAEDARAFAAIDLDGDGCLDLVLKNRLAPQVRAMRNQCGQGKPVFVLRLRGTKSNRDAIGARVEVNTRVQFVTAGSGYLSQHTKNLHFALDNGGGAHVKVTWPSGMEQTTGALAAGFVHEIEEGSPLVRSVPFAPRLPAHRAPGALSARNDPELGAAWLLDPIRLPDSHPGPGFVVLFAGSNPLLGYARVPVESVDLSTAPEDTAAIYSILRRYLFEYRSDLNPPLLLLVDERSRLHKIYFKIPVEDVLTSDLARIRSLDFEGRALPFSGRYYQRPGRNFMKLGSAFYWSGYPEPALAYFAEASSRDPENWKAWSAGAEIHLEAGRYAQARDGFARTLKLRPDSVPALFGAGQACAKLDDLGGAERFFQRVLQSEPNDADAANQLGLVYERQNRDEDAKRFFERAIQVRRDHSPAINNLGALYMKLGKPNDAIAALRYGIGQAPDDARLYINLARVYLTIGDRQRARDSLIALLERRPDDPAGQNALRELDAAR